MIKVTKSNNVNSIPELMNYPVLMTDDACIVLVLGPSTVLKDRYKVINLTGNSEWSYSEKFYLFNPDNPFKLYQGTITLENEIKFV
jgi:hypothetical protein